MVLSGGDLDVTITKELKVERMEISAEEKSRPTRSCFMSQSQFNNWFWA